MFYAFKVWVLCLHVCLHAERGHQIQLYMITIITCEQQFVTGNLTKGLWKSSQCNNLLSHLSRPSNNFYPYPHHSYVVQSLILPSEACTPFSAAVSHDIISSLLTALCLCWLPGTWNLLHESYSSQPITYLCDVTLHMSPVFRLPMNLFSQASQFPLTRHT